MHNKDLNVKASDTTGDDSSNTAKYIIIQLTFKELIISKAIFTYCAIPIYFTLFNSSLLSPTSNHLF
jgi:hypothetical protein